MFAFVYKGAKDITEELNSACFIWNRASQDEDSDKAWNDKYAGGRKSIEITNEDVYKRATFSCSIDMELSEKILKTKER